MMRYACEVMSEERGVSHSLVMGGINLGMNHERGHKE
jgi:hypothetical protein